AAKWCSDISKNPEARTDLETPTKARQISAPPEQDRAADDWSNIKVQNPKPGDIVNRMTCSWYVMRLHREAVLKWGLTAYAREDFKLAKKLWTSLYEIDSYFADEEKKGWGSVVYRLLRDIEHQPGCLYADPAEMASFKQPNMRLGVLLADLAFENNEYDVAAEKYQALLAEPLGRLIKPQKAYITFALVRSLAMQFKEKEVANLIKGFDEKFAGTPTMPRFLLWRGNNTMTDLSSVKPGTPEWDSGIRDYAELIRQYPNTKYADHALYYWGWGFYMLNEFNKAQERFEAYLRQYPEGIWKDAAIFYLDQSKKKIPLFK
ncbi:MAG: tetratricopeptide repeat protein, partial [Planctomycetota bacterium]